MIQKQDNFRYNIFQVFFIRLRQHPGAATMVVLLVLLGFLSIGFVYQKLAIEGSNKAALIASKSHAATQATLVNNFIKTETKKFSAFIERPWVIQTLENQDQLQLTNLEQLLARLSENVTESLIVLPNDLRILDGQNYAAREMLLTAQQTGKAPAPEAIKVAQQWVAIFVTPILSREKKYLGALVTQLDLTALKTRLSSQSFPGRTEVIQKLPSIRKQTILSTANPPGTDIQGVSPTTISSWSIVFTANKSIYTQVNANLIAILKITGSIAVFYLLMFILLSRHILNRYQSDPLPQPKITIEESLPEGLDSDSFLQAIPSSGRLNDNQEADSQSSSDYPDIIPEQGIYPKLVFREYDIRGIYGEQITAQFALQLGKAVGSMALSRDESALITAFDGRLSSPLLYQSLEEGILSTGCDVLHIGAMPTPALNFATHIRKETASGIIVTASHNPADYNGFKICMNNQTVTQEDIQQLYKLMANNKFHEGQGKQKVIDVEEEYVIAIREDVVPGYGLKIVVDAGNGITGKIAPRVIQELGCIVIPLYCSVDGSFPNHSPDTSKAENLVDLIEAVKSNQADLGIALDGDGDRLVAISPKGNIIWPDELLMIFARDVLSRIPGADIVFDVKSTRRLNNLISSYSGRPVICKTGHSNMRSKLEECDSPLAGEYSGHIFFRDRWFGFDDGVYAAARLIEIITTREQNLDEIVSAFDKTFATHEITIAVPEEEKFQLIEKLIEGCDFKEANISTLDGLKADYPKAWGLVRASNTSAALTLRFEGDSEQALEHIQSLFKQQMRSIDSRLTF